jgi:hypothetical protein
MQQLTKKMAESRIKVLENQVKDIEKKIESLALEHEIELYRGEYGLDGRQFLLWDHSYSGKKRGQWLYSSEEC